MNFGELLMVSLSQAKREILAIMWMNAFRAFQEAAFAAP